MPRASARKVASQVRKILNLTPDYTRFTLEELEAVAESYDNAGQPLNAQTIRGAAERARARNDRFIRKEDLRVHERQLLDLMREEAYRQP